MNLISDIQRSIEKNYNNNAFCINNKYYTYKDFALVISAIRKEVQTQIKKDEINIGLITNDDIYTYASIIALWMEGKAYIPINSSTPFERNKFILQETDTKTVLDSEKNFNDASLFNVIDPKSLSSETIKLEPIEFTNKELAYILFTSGSTGTPKGVPISIKNLCALVSSINSDKRHDIKPEDKCLQMFELTFDFSLVTFLMPLLSGACIYTIPKDEFKYSYIYELIEDAKLTYLIMVPSVIHYLRPYFEEIKASNVRYCCFGAAPLHNDIVEEWKQCIPNAKLYNSYGPTEFTVTTSYYSFLDNIVPREKNGIVSLGKPMKGVKAIIIDEHNTILPQNTEGELCLSGGQLTSGYWNNDKKNELSFFTIPYNQKATRFYKTGDLCIMDDDGYLIFIGRKDFQVKISGYRVELSEVDFYAKDYAKGINIIAIDILNASGNTEIALVIESAPFDIKPMLNYMKTKIPEYMIPTRHKFIETFPLNNNDKIDRKKMKQLF